MRCTRLESSEVQSKFAKNGKHYFILLACNGEIVGQSQMYTHDSSANNAPTAKVDDLSDS